MLNILAIHMNAMSLLNSGTCIASTCFSLSHSHRVVLSPVSSCYTLHFILKRRVKPDPHFQLICGVFKVNHYCLLFILFFFFFLLFKCFLGLDLFPVFFCPFASFSPTCFHKPRHCVGWGLTTRQMH